MEGPTLKTRQGAPTSPSPAFVRFGWTTAAWILASIVFVYGVGFFQLDGWKAHFFRGTLDPGSHCTVTTRLDPTDDDLRRLASSPEWPGERAQVKLPHPWSLAAIGVGIEPDPGRKLLAHYQCQVAQEELARLGDGVTQLHPGWIVNEVAHVWINKTLRLTLQGNDKPSLPLLPTDLQRPEGLAIDIVVLSSAQPLGLIGNQPMAIARGYAPNARILGLETSIQSVRYLYRLLPALILGLVLVFGWHYGLRSHLLLAALFYFSCAIAVNLLQLYQEFLPWGADVTSRLLYPLDLAHIGSFLIFALVQTQSRPTLPLGRLILANIVSASCLLAYMALSPRALGQLRLFAQFNLALGGLGAMTLLVHSRGSHLDLAQGRRAILRTFQFLLVAYVLAAGIDSFMIYARIPIRSMAYLAVVVPIFVGWGVLYSLALIEKDLQDERTRRQRLERDLELAREIQDSIAPPPVAQEESHHTLRWYHAKHQTVGGDWFAMRRLSESHHVVVVSDASGKGVQAALVIHAVQSLWADALGEDHFDPALWITRVHRTLLRMGERQTHSMTLGLLEILGDRIRYWNAGHLPVFTVEEDSELVPSRVTSITGRGGMLGVPGSAQVTPAEHMLLRECTLLLATDGVLPRGTRTSPRELRELLASTRAQGSAAIMALTSDDDRTLITIDWHAARSSS